MRALWSDRPNCSHNVSQKVKRIRRFSEKGQSLCSLFLPENRAQSHHWDSSLNNVQPRGSAKTGGFVIYKAKIVLDFATTYLVLRFGPAMSPTSDRSQQATGHAQDVHVL